MKLTGPLSGENVLGARPPQVDAASEALRRARRCIAAQGRGWRPHVTRGCDGAQAGEYVTDAAAEAAAARARAKQGGAPLQRADSKQRTVLVRARACRARLRPARRAARD